MTAFDGARESWEAAEPRPVWRIAKDAAALLLAIICSVEFVFILWVFL
jgi:hypothetical protein